MLASLLILSSVSVFPSEPIADQVTRGAKIAVSMPGASLNDFFASPEPRADFRNVWGEDQAAIGWWSNGHKLVPVEHVLWVSPQLISRWLGFLERREYWDEGELQTRWKQITEQLEGKQTFIVTLSAYPKMPFRGIGDYKRPSTEEIEDVRFVYTSGEKHKSMSAVRIAALQSRERGDFDSYRWWHHVDFSKLLIGEFESTKEEYWLPLGDYHKSWYLVTVEGADDEKFEVRVLSRRKERIAKFRSR